MCTILVMAVSKGLHICQMDVKGAYLNSTLKEKVYMHQPKGYEDKTNRVCLLVKMLYGLKQSGQEWNMELDMKLKKHNFTQLHTDPCVYLWSSPSMEFEVITIWVDNLLLFASSAELNEKMKRDLSSKWEITVMSLQGHTAQREHEVSVRSRVQWFNGAMVQMRS